MEGIHSDIAPTDFSVAAICVIESDVMTRHRKLIVFSLQSIPMGPIRFDYFSLF